MIVTDLFREKDRIAAGEPVELLTHLAVVP
jgi:hypothetical protein